MHLPQGQAMDASSALAGRWATLLGYRERALAAMEAFRAQKHAAIDAQVTITPRGEDRALLVAEAACLADLFGVSAVVLTAHDTTGDARVEVDQAPGQQCPRCRKFHTEPGPLCARCTLVVAKLGVTAPG